MLGFVQVQTTFGQVTCSATLAEGSKTASSLSVTISNLPSATPYTVSKGSGASGSLSLFTPSPTGTVTGFTDNTVTAGGTFRYQINYSSCTSSTLLVYIPTVAVTGLTATSTTSGQVSLSWSAPTGATGYNIERATGSGVFASIASNVSAITYMDNTSMSNTTYTYRITPLNNGVAGAIATATITTNALATTTVYPVKVSPIKIAVNWAAVTGATNQVLERSTSNTGPWTNIASGATTTSFVDWNSGLGLTPNTTYYYRVVATFANGQTTTSPIASEATYALQPARNLTSSVANCSTIDLNWTDAIQYDGYGEENYAIYRAEGASTAGATLVATVALNATSWTDSNLKPNTTYTYYVTAIYPASRFDAVSNTTSNKTTDFTISTNNSSISATTATINWAVCSQFHQGYEIYLNKNGVPQGKVAVIGKGSTSYTFRGLEPNTNYSATVHPQVNGSGGNSNSAVFKTLKYPIPSNLVTESLSNTKVKLTWQDTSTDADPEESWYITRTTDNFATSKIIERPSNNPEFIDENLDPNTKYCYIVQGRNAGGLSEPSNLGCATTCASIISKINKAEAIKTTQIQLKWDTPAGNTNSNSTTVVEASNDGVQFTELARIGGGINTYLHDNLTAGQKVTYRIIAINNGECKGTYTPEISTRTCPDITKNVVAKPVNSTTIDITWTSQPNVTEYVIERSLNSVVYTTIGTVKSDKTSFTDTQNLLPLTKYWYRVYAKNEGGCDGLASLSTLDAIAETCPAPPTNLVATSNTSKEIKVTYNDNAPAETGFDLEISKDDKIWLKSGIVIAPNVTTVLISKFDGKDLEPETKYFFRVRSLGCNSNFTNSVNTTTNPPAPTSVTAKGVKINQIDLAWTNTAKTATGIEVETSSIAQPTYTKIASLGATSTTYSTQTALTPNTLYNYRLRYTSPNGNSDWSVVASGTTLVITADELTNNLENTVEMFPIPAQNNIFVKPTINLDGKVTVKILGANGASIITKNYQGIKANKAEEINISSLKSGIYIMQLQTKKGKVAKKFLKQ
jgi:hypothetical protein